MLGVDVADILTFLQRPDNTVVAAGLATYQDGRLVTPQGTTQTTTAPATPIVRVALSLSAGNVQTLFPLDWSQAELTGSAKLAQRFLLHLFTRKGSMRYRPRQGCMFAANLAAAAATETDVFVAFAAALRDVRTNLQAEELATDPADERFAGARVERLTVARSSVTMAIRVTTLAGSTVDLAVPLPLRF